MNFHLVCNNPVYIDFFIKKAEKLSNKKNCYVLISDYKTNEIKSKKVLSLDLNEALSLFNKYTFNKVFIHYLNNNAINFINKIKIGIPIYWFFWGADGYKHRTLKKNIYMPETKRLVGELFPVKGIAKVKIYYRDLRISQRLNQVFSRIDYCCTQVKGDFNLIKSISPASKMQHLYFTYRGIDIKHQTNNEIKKKLNILLGNSANPTNNHLDILHILSKYDMNISKIICPLSYSGPQNYIKEVISKGKYYFGDKFYPLLQFLPLKEYASIMDTIDVGVFYHSRQQAYSNTIMMLGQGKKILMNSNSTLFHMYKDFGAKNVFSDFGVLFNSPIILENDLETHLGEDIVDQWYKTLLN